MRTVIRLAGALLLVPFTMSCDDSPDEPALPPDVHLSLEVTRTFASPESEISTIAVVWNTSGTPAFTWNDCCGLRPYVEIRDPGGAVVRSNPCFAECPGYGDHLDREPKVASVPFNGLVFAEGGWVPAPHGEYTVTATFQYADTAGRAFRTLREEKKFTWSGE